MTPETTLCTVPQGKNSTSNSGVRFALKKRSIRNSKNVVNLSSYNSDFLTGLFQDVANATDSEPVMNTASKLTQKRSSDLISDIGSSSSTVEEMEMSPRTPERQAKKSRTDSIISPYSFRASTFNLSSLEDQQGNVSRSSTEEESSQEIRRAQDSLAFQLNCVSESTDECQASPSVDEAAKVAFPNLPATVSDSSCNSGLTRANLVRQASNLENNSTKESFGWFVDLDDNQTIETNSFLPYAVSTDNLAFQAPTAPKRVNDVAELEWAQAADTVDDVLGDFF